MRTISLTLMVVTATACSVQHWQSASVPPVDEHMAHMMAADMDAPAATRASGRFVNGSSQGAPGLPASNESAAARLGASPRHGEWVKVAWGPGSADSLMAWIVYPVRSGKAPVVVVVHEIFGLSTWVRAVTDQLAAQGYIAIAPDILSRVRGGPSSVELSGNDARNMIGRVPDADRYRTAVNAAANYAMTQPSALARYAVIGFCWGGTTVWGHAIDGGVQGFAAGVAYYGAPPYSTGGQSATPSTPATPVSPSRDSLAKIRVPILLLNGARDARIGTQMPAIDSAMRALGKVYAGVNYDGAIHGFLRAQDDPATGANADAGAANLAAARDAWPRTVSFLRQHLGP
ncbi:MAG: dienelactone hydrolase family protein [Gemmatimonadota bacterium]|nr:dienelactone hydrolase family protein [Gemmatimonadota bacterium]